ncbi:methyl-accepting chemotaxis protein [Salipaludibacillus daqingensis]|uniref:methyl-accepting chemotaxis protein n=1 Tax=Salipaludibacillus daqingensis TaxID=3041001 RepID=UPI00247544D3|nr:methyl-accepting chemotaxis protein [Salipaludibacillus daqingensis]
MLKNMKILTKFQLVMVATIIGISAILLTVTYSQVKSGIESFAAEKASSDLELSYQYVNEKHEGSWQILDGDLYKGDHRINEDYDLADEIAEMTGGLVTVFQGRQPITTNLIINDERAVSVEATGEVTELVLEDGQMYYGEADILGTDMQTAYRPILDENGAILGMFFMAASQEIINSIMTEVITYVGIVVAVILIITTILLLFFSRKIKSRIQTILDNLQLAGDGDFRNHHQEESNDELGQISISFNKMKENLSYLLQNVTSASDHLASSSEELTATSEQSAKAAEDVAKTIEDISKGATDQAADTEKGSAEVNELGSTIDQNQNHVEKLNDLASELRTLKDQGVKLVGDLIEKTTDNNRVTEEVHEMISETNSNTEKIESASGMIKSISEQTNLLALNASIEAARAGEAGKGFSVVADEIRKLAEQSNKFSEEISTIIQMLAEKTTEAVSKMDESKQMSVIQSKSVHETTATFDGVAKAIERMRLTLDDLNHSGENMHHKKEEIIRVIENLSAISEENAASTEEMSAAIEEQTASMEEIASSSETLAKLAENMQTNVSKFKY